MRNHLLLSIILATAGAACASSGSHAEKARDAHNERIDENTAARTRTIERREEANVEGIEEERVLTNQQIDAHKDSHAAQDIEDAKRVMDVSAERATYQTKANARVQTIAVRIDAAQQKLRALGSAAPRNNISEVEALREQHSGIKRDLNALPEIPAASWEAEHEALDQRISELNRRVKLLTDAIEDA